MSEFINTVDLLGDDVVLGGIIDGSLTEFKDNVLTTIGLYAFIYCKNLETVDLSNVTSIGQLSFYECSKLTSVILRSNTLCELSSSNDFGSTPIAKGTGYVYVPRVLVDTYKSATNWTARANQIRAIEDYSIDGTTTGELDPSKI